MNMKSNTATVVPHQSKVTQQSSEKKWGKAVLDLGFSVFPSLVFRAQARLGLSPVQLALLLHLADYWWHREQMPYPSKATLAERMHLSPRQIQRHLTALETSGFIARVARFTGHKGQQSNEYDLTGFVKRLQKIVPEFSAVKEQAKRVAKRGGLAANMEKKIAEANDE